MYFMTTKKQKTQKRKNEIAVALLDVRSAYNVGSVFRTADTAGVSKIYLLGYTPAPRDRFGRERKDIAKVALGAEKNIAWQEKKNAKKFLNKLKSEGAQIIGVEQAPRAKDYRKFRPKVGPGGGSVFVFGNETKGLSKEILKICDEIIEIPMRGKKESLNVSVSAGIILFKMLGND